MRASLEEAVGAPIRVAAILFTHGHYVNGTGAFLDEGTETWGHELLDARRRRLQPVPVARAMARRAMCIS